MEKDVTIYEGAPPALRLGEVKAQVELIQEIMKSVMRENEHYGIIPGCGNKPTLLQPGAQKLVMTFRLVPDPEVTIVDLPREHREYQVKVKLYTQNGIFLGAGVGSCSTMEGKFRYRKADLVCPECGKETIIKGKAEFGGGWLCYAKKGGCGKKWTDADNPFAVLAVRVEHDNPADYYNTCEKMAYKRALVSATLTVTAASDIFTQDIEDMPEVLGDKGKNQKPPIQPPQAKTETTTEAKDGVITITATIEEISSKSGEAKDKKTGKPKPWTLYGIKADEQWYNTFDKKLADEAQEALHHKVEIAYIQTEKSKNLTKITMVGQPDLLSQCTQDPKTCDRSTFDQNDKAFCDYEPLDPTQSEPCKFQKVK